MEYLQAGELDVFIGYFFFSMLHIVDGYKLLLWKNHFKSCAGVRIIFN